MAFPRKKDSWKSHTCEEGGAHLKISFWHLLMNLKNKYLLKKPLKLANKKQNNFNIYNARMQNIMVGNRTCPTNLA